VAATVLREWRVAAVKGLADVFEKRDSVTELKAAHERQVEDRYAEIGRRTTHVNVLGRYSFSLPEDLQQGEWRSLRVPVARQ
jgi:hypothetical protein